MVLALVQGAVGVVQYATHTGASYQGEDIRAVGTFGPGDVMGMATVVAYGLIVATAMALAPGLPPRVRRIAGGCALLLVLPLVLSFSRGAWIATAGAALLVMVLAGIRRALKVLVALCAAGVVLVGGLGVGSDMVAERLTSITQVSSAPDQSVTDRYTMWAAAESMWRERPAVGVGLKGFPAHRDGHASLGLSSGSDTAGAGQGYLRQPLLSPHNQYLLILSEQGLIGLAALVGGWAVLLVAGLRRLASGGFGGGRGIQDCGLIALGLLVWQLTDFLYADIGGPSTVLTGVIIGLAAWWALPLPSRGAATGSLGAASPAGAAFGGVTGPTPGTVAGSAPGGGQRATAAGAAAPGGRPRGGAGSASGGVPVLAPAGLLTRRVRVAARAAVRSLPRAGAPAFRPECAPFRVRTARDGHHALAARPRPPAGAGPTHVPGTPAPPRISAVPDPGFVTGGCRVPPMARAGRFPVGLMPVAFPRCRTPGS